MQKRTPPWSKICSGLEKFCSDVNHQHNWINAGIVKSFLQEDMSIRLKWMGFENCNASCVLQRYWSEISKIKQIPVNFTWIRFDKNDICLNRKISLISFKNSMQTYVKARNTFLSECCMTISCIQSTWHALHNIEDVTDIKEYYCTRLWI